MTRAGHVNFGPTVRSSNILVFLSASPRELLSRYLVTYCDAVVIGCIAARSIRCGLLLPMFHRELSLCMSLRHVGEPCKSAEPIKMPSGLLTCVRPWNQLLDAGGRIPCRTGSFGGRSCDMQGAACGDAVLATVNVAT